MTALRAIMRLETGDHQLLRRCSITKEDYSEISEEERRAKRMELLKAELENTTNK